MSNRGIAEMICRTFRPDPKKIVVPRTHGNILAEPPLREVSSFLKTSSQVPSSPKRLEARKQLLSAATQWATVIDAPAPPTDAENWPWILTGHQVEFYHAGVWAKVLAADSIAKHSGNAIAFDLLVDHDVIDRIGFDVPVEKGNGGWARTWEGVPTTAEVGLPAESLLAPSMDAFLNWDAAIAEYPATQTDTMAYFLSALRHGIAQSQNHPDKKLGYTQWLSQARAGFERSLGLTVYHVPATWVCRGPAWDSFVQAWIDNAEKWIEVYNRHLAAYRRRQGIKSTQHPMPDLTRNPARGEFELPFWTYRHGEPRQRFMIGGTTNAGLSKHGAPNIRPRALTFTMFARLFLADIFIHGIGGALYDQITDGIIEELFQAAPPYCCVSAAWLLPLGHAFHDEDFSTLKWRRHHISHNPQLAIDPFTSLRTDVAELIVQRKDLIAQIAKSLADSRAKEREQRHGWFKQLHDINLALHQKAPRILPKLDNQITEALAAKDQNKVLLWREWFFGLHSIQSLENLKSAIQSK